MFPCFVFFLSLSRLYFLSHCLPVHCPAHQLPCGRNRRGIEPLHSRTMRSIATWRYTILSQKPDALFSSRSDELGNQFASSMFKCADPSNSGRILLEGNKDHLLSQATSELMRQGHQVGSLNSCISELQQQAYAHWLESQDAQHGYVESRREQARLQEELSMKAKVVRDTQIRGMHAMGEMKRAQKLRIDEVSVQKLREIHEAIQKLTSLLQEMQELMNSLNDSGEFQVSRFQSACIDSRFSFHAEPRQTLAS